MKESPNRPKLHYHVLIDDQPFDTWAYNEEGARSNAAYRYAQQEDEPVKLIMWKIKQGEINIEVEEL